MVNLAYIRLVWRNNRGIALFSLAMIASFQFLLLYLVTTFDTAAMISSMLDQMPPMIKAFLQDSFFSMLTSDGAAAFGFNHPIVMALLVIVAVNIPVHHITQETESGTLELLLSHPFPRRNLIFSLWFSGCLILLMIIISALAGSYLSMFIFHELSKLIVIRLLQIGFNLWLLIVLIFSYTLLIAVFALRGMKAGNLSAVITLVFYLLYFLSQIWDDIKFTKPLNIFSYFEPQALISGGGHFGRDIIVLGTSVIICFGISFRRFERRDIP